MRISITLTAFFLATASIASAAPPKPVLTEIDGKGYHFEYSYPAVAQQYPLLVREIERLKTAQHEELKEMGEDWIKSDPEGTKTSKMETDTSWQTVTDLTAYLSLTTNSWSFTGGAHGNWWRSSLVWDKTASKVLQPIDIFTSNAAFDRLVQMRYCDKLDIQRSEKRDGEKVDRRKTDDWTQACPKPSEQVLILGSSNGKQFNRFSIYAGPYAAGPYSEGEYEIDLTFDKKLLAIVKPQFRPSFALSR